MKHENLQNPEEWAAQTFGMAECGDPRRTDRLVQIAAALAGNPSGSLPECMRSWNDTQAAYRLLENEAVTYEQIMKPHWTQTAQEAAQYQRTLLLADTTNFTLSTHTTTSGLGPIGRGKKGKGYYAHTVVAMDADQQQLLGCLYQDPFVRQPAPRGETREQRKKRARESQVWERSIQAIGPVPEQQKWIYVGDRGSDIFTFWETCQDYGYDFLIRVAQDRRVRVEEEPEEGELWAPRLKEVARHLPAQAGRVVHLPAQHGRAARDAFLQISFQAICVQPPLHGACMHQKEITLWILRAWEPTPPAGQEPLEWLLLTTVPIEDATDAWERVGWYKCRWLLEEFHKVLKTGCVMEDRLVQSVESQWKLLGILTPVAMRLLWLRQTAQLAPETPATEIVSHQIVQLVCLLAKRPKVTLTARELWRTIAGFGGYLGRKSDGPPGWQTLWKGWRYVLTVLEGVHLAVHFSSS